MATKAADAAEKILTQTGLIQKGGSFSVCGSCEQPIVHAPEVKGKIASIIKEELAATIERCAQIADGLQAEAESQVREFRRLSLSGCAMQSQSEMTAYRSAAAAIRSMGDAK